MIVSRAYVRPARGKLDGVSVCHFGDFGQSALRDEQAEAIGDVDLLFVPVGAGPTIGAEGARAVIERLRPRWTVAMHLRSVTWKLAVAELASVPLSRW